MIGVIRLTNPVQLVENRCFNIIVSPTEIPPYIRTISGKGSLTIPESFQKAVRIFLYVDVIRLPKSPFRSFRRNPPDSFFGYITANIGNYVLETYSIDYDRQVFELFRGDNAQLMRAVKCLEKAVRNYVFLGTGNPAVVFIDQLAEFEPNRYDADNFKFVCYGGTALRLELKGYEPSNCGEDDSDPPPPPPPPGDEPFPQTSPDEPVEVSPPEPGEPDETDPFEGDEIQDPPLELPIEGECLRYRFTITYDRYNVGAVTVQVDLGAPIIGFYTEEQVPFPPIDGLYAECNGVWGTGGQCAGVLPTLIYNDLTGGSTFTIDSIELVEE